MEAEAMLLGPWKSFQELEDNMSLEELTFLLNTRNKDKEESMTFQAALKGIDLGAGSERENKERLEDLKRRAEAKLQGKTDEELEKDIMLDDFGLEIETE